MIGQEKISIFKNIFDTAGKYAITISDALSRIKSGKSAKAIISLRNEADEKRREVIKSNLPSVTFSGTFRERFDDKLVEHSGFICLDFDDIDKTDLFKNDMAKSPYTYATWTSPSGNGVKVLIRIASGEKHREHFAALQKIYPTTDHKCINVSRVCYESYDEQIYINTDAQVFTECLKTEVVVKPTENLANFDLYKKIQRWAEADPKRQFYEGNRNAHVFVVAAALCRFGMSEDDSLIYLLADYVSDGFPEKEISRTVRSAYRANRHNAGTAEFTNDKITVKETKYEISPEIFKEGYVLEDVIYGTSVYDGAVEIYESGYKAAETTFIQKLDKHFKHKRGELTLVSGIGNYGKSAYVSQLQLIRSLLADNKWAVFSPENNPASEYYFDLTESLIGAPCHKGSPTRPHRAIFDRAYEFVSKHFFYVYPETVAPTPKYIFNKFRELVLKERVDGVLIDPFNQLSNSWGARSDKYLESFLPECIRFAQDNNIFFQIIAHPHKLNKGGALDYPCPDVFEIADGAMWNNMCDNILIYHRPTGQSDPNSPICEHHSKKIRRQKIVGIKGMFDFEYDRTRRRFYWDRHSPLDGNEFESHYVPRQLKMEGNPNAFTESKKEEDTSSCPF